MRYLVRIITVLVGSLGLLTAAPAVIAHADGSGSGRAVFVQTNDPAGNSIDVFTRGDNGALTFVASYPTGGKGDRAASAASDPLASQSSLVYDAPDKLLLGVNAGSNSVSVFSVSGTRLHLNQVVGSGGQFPNSIAVQGNLAYVEDAGGSGFVQGYRIAGGLLQPIEGSGRSLNLGNSNPPFFLAAPGQVGFTPDGGHLIVTLKGHNGGSVDVFGVLASGRLTAQPTTTVVGGLPFSFTFDPAGQLALLNPAFASLSTYTVNADGSLTLVSAGPSSGQGGACWVVTNSGFYLTGNTGSNDLSEYTISSNGTVSLINPIAAAGIPGAIDMASAGQFLYSQSGLSSSVKGFLVNNDGTLAPIGSFAVPDGSSQEGIAAQ